MKDNTSDNKKICFGSIVNDPKKIGIAALLSGFASFFIFGASLSLVSIVYGSYGFYVSLKKRAGAVAIALNICAIILGLAVRILLEVAKHGK